MTHPNRSTNALPARSTTASESEPSPARSTPPATNATRTRTTLVAESIRRGIAWPRVIDNLRKSGLTDQRIAGLAGLHSVAPIRAAALGTPPPPRAAIALLDAHYDLAPERHTMTRSGIAIPLDLDD